MEDTIQETPAETGSKGDLPMDKIQKLKKEKEYEKYVNQKTPRHNVWLNMLKGISAGRHDLHTRTGHLSLLRVPLFDRRRVQQLDLTDPCPDQRTSHRDGSLSPSWRNGAAQEHSSLSPDCKLRSRPGY